MKKDDHSRRQFLRQSSITGLGAALGMSIPLPSFSKPISAMNMDDKVRKLNIQPRYHRWHVDPGVEWLETNTSSATLKWEIPLAQTALVLLDVWQRHYLKEPEERAEEIINNKFIPLLATCRQEGMNVIHAPSPEVAMTHPNWLRLLTKAEMAPQRDAWPPSDFRNLSGPYKAYKRPHEPREAERQALPPLTFHPKIVPLGNEPVVATGEELHRYCKKQGILFLLFAGFNTNACILSRDYGAIHMSNRGYGSVLVRDCTTGMESKETQAELSQTNGAILLLEMFGQYTVSSDEIIKGFSV